MATLAVRRYDAEGLVTPERSSGRQRRYSRLDVSRLARAGLLAEDGVALVGIRRIMALEDRLTRARPRLPLRANSDAASG